MLCAGTSDASSTSDAARADWHYGYGLAVGGLTIVAGVGCSAGTTLCQPDLPMVLLGYGGELELQYQGRSWSLRSGECLVISGRKSGPNPSSNSGSELVWSRGPYSLVSFHFEWPCVLEAIRLMGGLAPAGAEDELGLKGFDCWSVPTDPLPASLQAMVRELIEKADRLVEINPIWLDKLQLEDQIYRHLAAMLVPELCQGGAVDRLRQREREGRDGFDELIDYIKANLDQPLNLTLLESRSHYSRRALQYAFRERLGCTPTQWIRTQRLDLARQLLENPHPTDSVTSIATATATGYRSLSLFSVDFQQRFHIKPSDLLREARASRP